jgi:phosphatidylglycerophosphatase A
MQPRTILDSLCLHLSTLGPIGRIPFAPGTWGSLASLLVLSWGFVPLPPVMKGAVLILLFFLGGLAATRAEALLGAKDPQCVVFDEVVGQLLALIPLSRMAPLELSLGFILFRLFDMLKPWPVGASEHWLPQGFGIMIDDVFAGLYAAIGLLLIRLVI